MHAAFAQEGVGRGGQARFHASFPPSPVEPVPEAMSPPTIYGGASRPNWGAIATIVALHGLLLAALVTLDVIPIDRKAAPRLVVVDLSLAPPPPPAPPAAVEPEVAPVRPVPTVVIAPPPIVQTPTAPPPIAVVSAPPPPQATVVVPAASAASANSTPVSIDLSTKMVSAKPPRYPAESRRNREQGTVVLRLLLGLDGSVADIAVAQSSGFTRLDKAALEAVRRWRWSPTVQAGQAVQVRGVVEIPFVLQG